MYHSGHEKRMEKATAFFYEHAGFSYDPKIETEEQGHMRCARELAEAEYESSDLTFDWSVDPHTDSSDWLDEKPAYAQWQCICRCEETGKVLSALGGIDFGRDNEPWGNPYMRVVEAELASEALADAQDNN